MTYTTQNQENSGQQNNSLQSKTGGEIIADSRTSASVSTQLQTLMANSPIQKKLNNTAHMMANKPGSVQMVTDEELLQGQFEIVQRAQEEELLQGKFSEDSPAQLAEQQAPGFNNTGLPDNLKTGIESLSGMSMDHVKVHYNSDKPAQLQAHAYAQGSEIHVAPGEEKHLPHEAWHVVQQAQGRVKPTVQMKGDVSVNDDAGLEAEADLMGSKANTNIVQARELNARPVFFDSASSSVAQLAGTKPNQPSMDGRYRIKLSSVREAFTYENRAALGLNNVLPGHHNVVRIGRDTTSGKLVAVKIQGNDNWIYLKEPIAMPGSDQEVLCIDTVGWEDESAKEVKDQKCFMDIKIGTYTKSTEQFEREGAGFFTRLFKKIEHNLKDLNRDSRGLGYDIDADNLKSFLDLATADETSDLLHAAIVNIKPKLVTIQQAMRNAPITFVGSSVFIVFNLTQPANSDVKLIDPDHPIVITPGQLVLPDQLIKREHFTGNDRTWEDYVNKWQGGFGTGMDNVIEWFNALG